jgi:hypothetical protein
MKISKTHQRFADRLNDQRALDYPEEFLGPNWREVLNFWLYIDTLSIEQLNMASDLYWALDRADRNYAVDLANNAAGEVTSDDISHHAYMSAPGWAGGNATRELIGAHKILGQGKPLTFATLLINQNYS